MIKTKTYIHMEPGDPLPNSDGSKMREKEKKGLQFTCGPLELGKILHFFFVVISSEMQTRCIHLELPIQPWKGCPLEPCDMSFLPPA